MNFSFLKQNLEIKTPFLFSCGTLVVNRVGTCLFKQKIHEFYLKLCDDLSGKNVNVSHNSNVHPGDNYLRRIFPTKKITRLYALLFTMVTFVKKITLNPLCDEIC